MARKIGISSSAFSHGGRRGALGASVWSPGVAPASRTEARFATVVSGCRLPEGDAALLTGPVDEPGGLSISAPGSRHADEQVAELDRIAVVLEADRTFGANAGQFGVVDHGLAVELDRDAVLAHRDLEPVPLAGAVVGVLGRHGGFADLGRELGVLVVGVDVARAHGLGPDVDLGFLVASKEDAAVAG